MKRYRRAWRPLLLARQMFNEKTKAVMNPLVKAIAAFICYKEGSLCETLRFL